ncbi:MAG TPA: M48 family metallopeptidase [Candidatus Paceibacterota bacterium]
MRYSPRRKQEAHALVVSRITHFNQTYECTINRIVIRNQRRRWGSCSARGNLNFNYRLLKLPPALVDYIVVHELCHLRELNHSARFWKLVGDTLPDFRARQRALRRIAL